MSELSQDDESLAVDDEYGAGRSESSFSLAQSAPGQVQQRQVANTEARADGNPLLISTGSASKANPRKRKAPATPILGEDDLPIPKPAAKRKKQDSSAGLAAPGPGKAWRRGIKGPPKPVEYDANGQRVLPDGISPVRVGTAASPLPMAVKQEVPLADASNSASVAATSATPYSSVTAPPPSDKEKKARGSRPRKPKVAGAVEKAAPNSAEAAIAEASTPTEGQSSVNFTGQGRGVTGFLTIHPLLPKTPRPRKWERIRKPCATISGSNFTYSSYKPDSVSPLASVLAALEARDTSLPPEPANSSKPGPKRKKQTAPHPLTQQITVPESLIGTPAGFQPQLPKAEAFIPSAAQNQDLSHP